MSQTVIGMFDTKTEAQKAAAELVSAGFDRSAIDVAENNNTANTAKRGDYDGDGDVDTGDSIKRFFNSLFDGDDADNYANAARNNTVVTVHTQEMDRAKRAAAILNQFGAMGATGAAGLAGASSATGNTNTDRAIPVVEEELQVGKREVTTGGVRVSSRIVERPVEEHLRLRSEHVEVERRPVNRPATEAEMNTFKDSTVEMVEHAEEAVVNKEARVKEEITLRKEVDQRDETIRDTVRETKVDVENLDGKEARSKSNDPARKY